MRRYFGCNFEWINEEKSKELCGLWDSGYNRYGEIINLEVTIDRALVTFMKKDYSKEWINQRLQAIQVPKELTDTWNEHGIEEGREYAILINVISKVCSGMLTRQYKDFKNKT